MRGVKYLLSSLGVTLRENKRCAQWPQGRISGENAGPRYACVALLMRPCGVSTPPMWRGSGDGHKQARQKCSSATAGCKRLSRPSLPQAAPADSAEILRHLQGLSCSWESSASGSLEITVGVEARRLDILVGTMMLVDKRW